MLSALKNFGVTFLISALLFGVIAYFATLFVSNTVNSILDDEKNELDEIISAEGRGDALLKGRVPDQPEDLRREIDELPLPGIPAVPTHESESPDGVDPRQGIGCREGRPGFPPGDAEIGELGEKHVVDEDLLGKPLPCGDPPVEIRGVLLPFRGILPVPGGDCRSLFPDAVTPVGVIAEHPDGGSGFFSRLSGQPEWGAEGKDPFLHPAAPILHQADQGKAESFVGGHSFQ